MAAWSAVLPSLLWCPASAPACSSAVLGLGLGLTPNPSPYPDPNPDPNPKPRVGAGLQQRRDPRHLGLVELALAVQAALDRGDKVVGDLLVAPG